MSLTISFRIGFPSAARYASSASRNRQLRLHTVLIDPTPTLGRYVETVATRILIAQLFTLRQVVPRTALPKDHGVSAISALATAIAQISVSVIGSWYG